MSCYWLVVLKKNVWNMTHPLLRVSQRTSFIELKSTFPQKILFRLKVHSQVNTLTSTLIQKTTTTKTSTTTVSSTPVITTTAADGADATTTVLAPGISSWSSPLAPQLHMLSL